MALLDAHVLTASYWLNGSLALYAVPLGAGLFFGVGKYRVTRVLLIFLGAYLIGPNAWMHLPRVPVGHSHPQAPILKPAIGYALASGDLSKDNLRQQLNQQKTYFRRRAQWWCHLEDDNWEHRIRGTTGITAPKDFRFGDIPFREIYYRATTRISFIGRAEVPTSPLAKHISHPALHVYIDPPPAASQFGHIQQDTLTWLTDTSPLQSCALWIDEDSHLDYILQTFDKLKRSQCKRAIFIMLGLPPEDPTQWSTPFPCPNRTPL